MEHHCDGGYGVTNFSSHQLAQYLRAICEFASGQFWITTETLGGHLDYCLCCTDEQWESYNGLSPFWRIFEKHYMK